ncbi:carbohydrate sulfotransferase 12-like isoform X2 [Gymnodraco acuticeps]|uniref:Carbohydrate sulfotransferase n=1 Tax=Gymnodraco acuticeps TaxID=8218 RepID=A0A6P8V9M0_GYMAC|nr:carbohydrate sulfotransferase 12-like isoform X2 [Gymnodraco acuticeps]
MYHNTGHGRLGTVLFILSPALQSTRPSQCTSSQQLSASSPVAMAQYSGFKQLLIYAVSMFIIALSFYQWDMSQRKREERIHETQELRKQPLRETCAGDKETFKHHLEDVRNNELANLIVDDKQAGWNALTEERIHETQELRKQPLRETCAGDKETFKHRLEDVRNNELANLIVDDKHGIIYCYIPKVACTNWKRVMFSLTKDEPYPDPASISPDLVHLPNILPFLNSFPRSEIKAKLKHYTKFLYVRDPFVRLFSAYRNKFQEHNEYFYQRYGRHILRLYANQPDPPQSLKEANASGMRVSFQNFIQYLLDPLTERNEPFDPHWRQMQRLCLPCLIKYDFVGHQETLQQDASQLLKILMLQDNIQFPPSYENMTTPAFLLDWFSAVPLEDRRKLYELYEQDFRMFGYKRPRELLDG